jgi:proline iminopeptidase
MRNVLLIVAVMCFLAACKPAPDAANAAYHPAPDTTKLQSGGVQMIPISTPAGSFNVWTKRVGNNPKIKVLLLHGGPGGNHMLFESFESFFPNQGIEFIYYDQLGSAYSDKPTDTSLWQKDRFVEEVEQVRQALGLDSSNFFLLGHSWGGILAMEYALKYQQHLKGLIISNMMASCPAYGQYAQTVLAKQFDPQVLDTVRRLEAAGDFANPKYMGLLVPNFYEKHVCRVLPWPEALNRSLPLFNQTIYVQMQGPSEFGVGGNLVNWDRSKDLPRIKKPTLVIGATHDTMDPEYMRWMSTQLPKGQFLLCPNGSHCSMWDDQAHYFPGLVSFLKTTL